MDIRVPNQSYNERHPPSLFDPHGLVASGLNLTSNPGLSNIAATVLERRALQRRRIMPLHLR